MSKNRKLYYELRHVIDFKQPYITILVDTYREYANAFQEADRLRKNSPGVYLIKKITTEVLYISKRK